MADRKEAILSEACYKEYLDRQVIDQITETIVTAVPPAL